MSASGRIARPGCRSIGAMDDAARSTRYACWSVLFYAPLIDHDAGLLNDPVLIKRADDWFWFSIADSDVLLWAKGLALGRGLNVDVREPDVWPLAVQGPKAGECVARVFGDAIRSARYFEFC